MLYDGICVRMFICGYYRMWLHLHVYIDYMIYIYIPMGTGMAQDG